VITWPWRVVCELPGTFNGGLGNLNAIGTTNWTADFGTRLRPETIPTMSSPKMARAMFHASQHRHFCGAPVSLRGLRQRRREPTFPPMPLSTNLNGTNTTVGSKLRDHGHAGQGRGVRQLGWATTRSLFPTTNFTMENGLQMTANFISEPRGSAGFPSRTPRPTRQ
jgi:hypothetical protein